jgi:hypothetical protein
MMNKEKQIEEMTKAIDQAKYDMWVGKAHQSGDFTNHSKNIAKTLYAKGFRNAPNVVREIFEEIDRMCIDTFGNLNHRVFAELKKKYTEDNGRDKLAEFGKYSPLSWKYTEGGENAD